MRIVEYVEQTKDRKMGSRKKENVDPADLMK